MTGNGMGPSVLGGTTELGLVVVGTGCCVGKSTGGPVGRNDWGSLDVPFPSVGETDGIGLKVSVVFEASVVFEVAVIFSVGDDDGLVAVSVDTWVGVSLGDVVVGDELGADVVGATLGTSLGPLVSRAWARQTVASSAPGRQFPVHPPSPSAALVKQPRDSAFSSKIRPLRPGHT